MRYMLILIYHYHLIITDRPWLVIFHLCHILTNFGNYLWWQLVIPRNLYTSKLKMEFHLWNYTISFLRVLLSSLVFSRSSCWSSSDPISRVWHGMHDTGCVLCCVFRCSFRLLSLSNYSAHWPRTNRTEF